MSQFRYIGITDECVECQNCGKSGLRNTVVLAILDADGNSEDVTYYGSSCAAAALGVQGGSRTVLASARAAHDRTLGNAQYAHELLERFGLPLEGEPDDAQMTNAQTMYADAHRNAQWAQSMTPADWGKLVTDMLSRHRAAIREAALLVGR